MKKIFPLLFAAFIPTFAHAAPETVAAPTTIAVRSEIEPAAVELLERSAKAYAGMRSFSMKFQEFDHQNGNIGGGEIAFARPDKVKIAFNRQQGKSQSVAAGGKFFVFDANEVAGKYRQGVLLDQNPVRGAFNRIISPFRYTLAPLLAGETTLDDDSILGVNSLKLLPGNGVAMTINITNTDEPQRYRLFFGKDDSLLHRLETEFEMAGSLSHIRTTFSNFRVNPKLKAAELAFNAPKGWKATDVDPAYDPRLKVGAEPFPLDEIDLKEYRGKVVLLNFWQSDVPASLNDIKHIKNAYAKYHHKGFEVIGIPNELDSETVLNFMKQNDIQWTEHHRAGAYEDPNIIKYGLETLPFSLLLGTDGKIAAVNPRGKQLEPAILGALEK